MFIKHRAVVVIGLSLMLSPLVASAQRGTGKPTGVAQQAARPATVELAGTLESIQIGRCENSTGRAEVGMHLIVVTESGEKLNIHLGPASVASQWIDSLQVGEVLVIQAFATSEHAKDHYVAQRLEVGGVVINVRDTKLQPSWARGKRGRGASDLGQETSRCAAAGGRCGANGGGGNGSCRQWDDGDVNSGSRSHKALLAPGQGRGPGPAIGQGRRKERGPGAAAGRGRGKGRGRGAASAQMRGQEIRGQGRGGGQGQVGHLGKSGIRVPDLAADAAKSNSSPATGMETDHILFVREEEKLARDVYLTLAQRWSMRIFDNIAVAEQRHMDAMRLLIERYDLTDPVTNDAVGEFSNSTLQRLYDDLTSGQTVDLSYLGLELTIEGGASSKLAALKVGAFVEEFDILDILRRREETTGPGISNVYDNLLRASRSHLRAFVSVIKTSSADYAPVMMTGVDAQLGDLDALYLDIVSGDRETGKRRGRAN